MPRLERIQVGRFSCSSIVTFSLRSLPRLEYVDIGLNAFSAGDCRFPFCSAWRKLRSSDRSRVFELFVLQKAAKTLRIRRSSQFGFHSVRQRIVHGDFDFHPFQSSPSSLLFLYTDVPLLTDLLIGNDENMFNSYSFYCASEMQIEHLAALQTLDFGCFAFFQTTHFTCSDLPSLISLSFGVSSFNRLTELTFFQLPSLQSLAIGSNCMNSLPLFSLSRFHFVGLCVDQIARCSIASLWGPTVSSTPR